MIEAAVLGYGTVGSGVVEVITDNAQQIVKHCEGLHVKYILDLRDFPGDRFEDRIVHDVEVILSDPEVKVICETMGGVGAAYQFSKRALSAGKSVCTSNKELVELHGAELSALAAANSCSYLFEASVGGGIPLIRTITQALTAEKIERIYGILNGTTNYILHRMDTAGLDFETALKEAQEKGYAEKDPTADIEGHDPCRKIAILASLVEGKKIDFSDIPMEGITGITTMDMAYAKVLGAGIKLIAMCEFKEDGCNCMVSPRIIPDESPLACVKDVFNGVLIHSNMLDDSMYYGRGAGKLATASAVVGDAIECAKNAGSTIACSWMEEKGNLLSADTLVQKYLLRVRKEGAEQLKEKLGCEQELILTQKGAEDEMAFVTEAMPEGEFKKKIDGEAAVIGYIRF